jgi:hypothetical protein
MASQRIWAAGVNGGGIGWGPLKLVDGCAVMGMGRATTRTGSNALLSLAVPFIGAYPQPAAPGYFAFPPRSYPHAQPQFRRASL